MAVRISETFRGINSDRYGTQLPSGTADEAINVTLTDGRLQKRGGFAVAKASLQGIKGMWQANFADGNSYIVTKGANGKLYSLAISGGSLGAAAEIATEQTHNGSDRGWAFHSDDRWHYFDRVGGTRWHPSNLSSNSKAYKAGIMRATTGPTPAQAAGGEKDGWYHVVVAYYNSVTGEAGMHSGPHTPALECRLEDPDDKSGLAISNHTTIDNLAAAQKYEWDTVWYVSSQGNTEYFEEGVGAECFSHVYYDDAQVAKDAGTAGLNKADHVRRLRSRFNNAGGEPPGSQCGCFNESRAVYGKVWLSSALVEDQIKFSLAGHPTQVPQHHTYTQGGDSTTVEPIPWRGEFIGGMPGAPVVMAESAGMICAFTTTSAHIITINDRDGTMYPVTAHRSKGAGGDGAAVGTPHGVHAVGNGSWIIVSRNGVLDIADGQFKTTLAEIPVSQQSKTVLGYYGHRDQVWAAVVKTAATVAQRILVWEPGVGMVKFDIAGLAADEGITSLCELKHESVVPSMLVGTSAGRIFVYPSGTTDGGTSFAAEWQGYFAQERKGFDQAMATLRIHAGSNVKGNTKVDFTAMRTSGELSVASGQAELSPDTKTLSMSNAVEKFTGFDYVQGNVYRIRFYTASGVNVQWAIEDLSWVIERTDKQ